MNSVLQALKFDVTAGIKTQVVNVVSAQIGDLPRNEVAYKIPLNNLWWDIEMVFVDKFQFEGTRWK